MTDRMLDVHESADDARVGAFGEGGQTPYERALTSGSTAMLRLTEAAGPGAGGTSMIDVARFTASADEVDMAIVGRSDGPLIDLGCGPGRMVRAAIEAGRVALGIDVSLSAVELARSGGLPVLQRSLFDELPGEGDWSQALLLDGNLGIGGDVSLLMQRAVSLVRPSGVAVIEAHPRRAHDRRFEAVLVDEHGAASDAFPWAEMGAKGLVVVAREAGLEVSDVWSRAGRTFVEIARARRRRRAA